MGPWPHCEKQPVLLMRTSTCFPAFCTPALRTFTYFSVSPWLGHKYPLVHTNTWHSYWPMIPPCCSAELVVADVGGRKPALAQQEAQAGIHHRRRAGDIGADVGEPALHALTGHRVNEAAREAEAWIGGGQGRRHLFVGEGHRGGQPRRIASPERLELVEKEGVTRGADTEEDVAIPVREMIGAAGAGKDRHHPRDAAAPRDAENVLAGVRAKSRVAHRREDAEPRALHVVTEEPLAHRTPRLLLDHERQAPGSVVEVDHGIGARPAGSRHREKRKLAGLEIDGLVEVQVEGDDVVGEPTGRAHDATERARRGRGWRGRLERDRHLEPAGAASHALTHEELGRAFEIPATGSLRPLALDQPSQEGGLAGTAGARRALIGKLDAVAEAGVKNLLARLTGELTNAIPGAHVDVHRQEDCRAAPRGRQAPPTTARPAGHREYASGAAAPPRKSG